MKIYKADLRGFCSLLPSARWLARGNNERSFRAIKIQFSMSLATVDGEAGKIHATVYTNSQ